MREKIILCDGIAKEGQVCPLREMCNLWCPTMDKKKTDHFAWAPYNFRKGLCHEFEEKPLDPPFQLNDILNPINN